MLQPLQCALGLSPLPIVLRKDSKQLQQARSPRGVYGAALPVTAPVALLALSAPRLPRPLSPALLSQVWLPLCLRSLSRL